MRFRTQPPHTYDGLLELKMESIREFDSGYDSSSTRANLNNFLLVEYSFYRDFNINLIREIREFLHLQSSESGFYNNQKKKYSSEFEYFHFSKKNTQTNYT